MSVRLRKVYIESFDEHVRDMARRLHEVADEIEREGLRDQPNHVGVPEFGWKAGQVIHAVSWAVANLNMSQLVTSAAEIDALEPESS